MAGVLVHTFNLETAIFDDTAFPIQARGGGRQPDGRGIRADLLAPYVKSKLQIGNVEVQTTTATTTFSLPAGKWMVAMAVQSNTAQTFNMGDTLGGTEFIFEGAVPANVVTSFGTIVYGGTAGKIIHISNLSGVCTLNFLLV